MEVILFRLSTVLYLELRYVQNTTCCSLCNCYALQFFLLFLIQFIVSITAPLQKTYKWQIVGVQTRQLFPKCIRDWESCHKCDKWSTPQQKKCKCAQQKNPMPQYRCVTTPTDKKQNCMKKMLVNHHMAGDCHLFYIDRCQRNCS